MFICYRQLPQEDTTEKRRTHYEVQIVCLYSRPTAAEFILTQNKTKTLRRPVYGEVQKGKEALDSEPLTLVIQSIMT